MAEIMLIILCVLVIDTLIYLTIGYCLRHRVRTGSVKPALVKLAVFAAQIAVSVLAIIVCLNKLFDSLPVDSLEELMWVIITIVAIPLIIIVRLVVSALLFPIMFLSDRFLFTQKKDQPQSLIELESESAGL